MSKITYATKVVQHGDVRSEELNEPASAATIATMPPPPVTPSVPPAPPRKVVDIPKGEPAAVALQLLAKLNPNLADEMVGHVKECDRALAELVTIAGEQHEPSLPASISQAHRWVALRSVRESTLKALGRPVPDRGSVEVEVAMLISSVPKLLGLARGRVGQLVREWGQKKAQADGELQIACGYISNDTSEIDNAVWQHRASGLCHVSDRHMRRLTELLETVAKADNLLVALSDDDEAVRIGACVRIDYKPPTNPSEAPFKLITLGENQ